MKNQGTEQAGFHKPFSTADHIKKVTRMVEKTDGRTFFI